MEGLGVITKVHEPTAWCVGMVVVPKPNGKVRICVHLTKLNECSQRATPTSSCGPDTSTASRSHSVLPTRCNSGFWQIPLDPDSTLLTTFITPFGGFFFQSVAIRHNIASRVLSTPDVGAAVWGPWSSLHDGRYTDPWDYTSGA